MAKRVLHGPSAHVFGTDKRPKLLSSGLELPSSTSSHIEPSEAVDPSPGLPALRQDVGLTPLLDEPLAITSSLDEFLPSSPGANNYHLLWADFLEPALDTGVDQYWDCNPDLRSEQTYGYATFAASLTEAPHCVTGNEESERTITSSKSTEVLHQVNRQAIMDDVSLTFFLQCRKVAHGKLTTPVAEQEAPQGRKNDDETLVYDQQLPTSSSQKTEPPGPPVKTSAMTEQVPKSKRSLPCPFREAQEKLGLPYTCTAAPVGTVSAVRTHLIRKLPEGRPPHLPFLKLCQTCNDEIMDESEFENLHGKDGLKCRNPHPQRRGNTGQQEQYEILCSKVEAYIVAQGAQTRMYTRMEYTYERKLTILRIEVSTNDASGSPAASQAQTAQEQPTSPISSNRTVNLRAVDQNVG